MPAHKVNKGAQAGVILSRSQKVPTTNHFELPQHVGNQQKLSTQKYLLSKAAGNEFAKKKL
jgi:hypothetical protein